MNFILGLGIGVYIVIGFLNTAVYILSSRIVNLSYVNIRRLFMHFIAWPLYCD